MADEVKKDEITKSDKAVSIEKEIVALIKNKPFYAHFIQTMRRIVTEDIDTLAVNITDQINLYINPTFFNSLSPEERVACLEHEVLHIVHKHIIRVGSKRNHTAWNIACDVAINQFIKSYQDCKGNIISRLPKNCLLPEQFGFDLNLTTEKYYDLLMKNAKKFKIFVEGEGEGEGGKSEGKGKDGNGKGDKNKTLDDHQMWEKGNPNEDFQHQVVKNAIKKTMEATKDFGHLPAHIVEEITKALNHESVNWRSILQRFVYRATLVNNIPTRKKPNRRFGSFFDGSKVECKLDMIVAVDTSGSIGNHELAMFFSEIDKIKALGMKIAIIECDARVQRYYPYKTAPKACHGRGGTEFKPVFEYVAKMKMKPNCLIYLTDLYGDLNFRNMSKVPTLWAITEHGNDPKQLPFGYSIKLKDDGLEKD